MYEINFNFLIIFFFLLAYFFIKIRNIFIHLYPMQKTYTRMKYFNNLIKVAFIIIFFNRDIIFSLIIKLKIFDSLSLPCFHTFTFTSRFFFKYFFFLCIGCDWLAIAIILIGQNGADGSGIYYVILYEMSKLVVKRR